jgi:sortase A
MGSTGKQSDEKPVSPAREGEGRKNEWTVRRWIERTLLACGLVLLIIVGVLQLEGSLSSRAALRSFAKLEACSSSPIQPVEEGSGILPEDVGMGSGISEKAHADKDSMKAGVPIAILQIPKIQLEVPVMDGTDALTLNHAAGRIQGTARPGERGNIAIAAHRDRFFRGLKDVEVGDAIELRTGKAMDTYIVDDIRIVAPEDVSVLRPRQSPSLTLITCYPFYYIGNAPERYVVMASLAEK